MKKPLKGGFLFVGRRQVCLRRDRQVKKASEGWVSSFWLLASIPDHRR